MTPEAQEAAAKTVWKAARKKPVVVEYREVFPIVDLNGDGKPDGEVIPTREGKLVAHCGDDYIIKGAIGEVYPIGKAIFALTYDVIT